MECLNISFLAAQTSRSLAYAQALEDAGIKIKHTLIYSDGSDGKLGQPARELRNDHRYFGDILLPRFDRNLQDIACRISEHVDEVKTSNVNDIEVVDVLNLIDTQAIIYSGYGKQIVKDSLLQLYKPIIHMHAGSLPRFRGSTTIYYEMLLTGKCGVTGIFLDNGIDTGKVIFHRLYPKPAHWIDIDHVYDPAIRADGLVRFLKSYYDKNFTVEEQENSNSTEYYVIHPLLKHIAILGSK